MTKILVVEDDPAIQEMLKECLEKANYQIKVFSRQTIYETIWEEPYYDSDKTSNVHISNLRAKINLSNQQYIKTVWGIGFKFD